MGLRTTNPSGQQPYARGRDDERGRFLSNGLSASEGPGPFAAELVRAIERSHDVLVDLGRVAASMDERLAATIGEQDLDQVMRAFESVLVEALEQSGSETRRLLLTSAVPAAVAAGWTLLDIAQSNATFSVLLTALIAELPEQHRSAARGWLAVFMGEYLRDALAEAKKAGAE